MPELPIPPEVLSDAIDAYLGHTRPHGGHVLDGALEAAIRAALDELGLREELEVLTYIPGGGSRKTGRVRLVSNWRPVDAELAEPRMCGRIMVGSGGDTYDPTCELPEGHEGICRSRSAIDHHWLLACDRVDSEPPTGSSTENPVGSPRLINPTVMGRPDRVDSEPSEPATRNEVTSEWSTGPGGKTFWAPPPLDYEGRVVCLEVIRLGDHAHIEVSTGRQHANGPTREPTYHKGVAGHLVFAWGDWVHLRDALDAIPWVWLAEVEEPTPGQVDRYIGPRATSEPSA